METNTGTMITSAEEFIELRNSDDSEEYKRAAYESAAEDVWLDVIRHYPDMRFWVAHNKTVPTSILAILADDPDTNVRSMVASKRKASPAILGKLARDPDTGVRHSVACNAKAPEWILEALSDDTQQFVAETARERLTVRRFSARS